MAEFYGHASAVSLQKRLRDMHPEIAANPVLANGGRVLNVLDPEQFGWDAIATYLAENKFIGLTRVPKDATLEIAKSLFGETVDLPLWAVFTGTPQEVLPNCVDLKNAIPRPDRWRIESKTDLSDDLLHQIQELSAANGVAPTPAYYLRGTLFPSLSTCLWDDTGRLVGCANATMRYHPDGPLAGTLFAGGVAIDPSARGNGLGTLINAVMLCDAQSRFDWTMVLEQARQSNLASCGMIRKCGLREDPDRVTIVINLSDDAITR